MPSELLFSRNHSQFDSTFRAVRNDPYLFKLDEKLASLVADSVYAKRTKLGKAAK